MVTRRTGCTSFARRRMAQARTTSASIRDRETVEARIGSGASVRGRIHGEGDLVIEGHVEGDVAVRGNLTIAEGATVTSGAIEAHAVTIAGALEGDVAATGPVRLAPGSRVRGNLQGSAVTIDEGARFSGKLDCEFDLPPELGGASRGDRGEPRARASARR
jgi:cytoskeletal protein CcmA (bactofilin family)